MTDAFEFTFEDAFEYGRKMLEAPEVVESELVSATDRLVIAGLDEAIRVVPFDTHFLQRSLAKEHTVWTGDGARGVYGTATTYAPFVEEGTSKMAAQPYMQPSMELVQREMAAEYGAMLKRIRAAIEGG